MRIVSSCRVGSTVRRVILSVLALLGFLGLGARGATAQSDKSAFARPVLRSQRLVRPPVIDGILDDEAWRAEAIETGAWLSYNPLHGDPIPQRTRVWVGHDANYLYFAFQCDDPEPDRVKTSITRRDNIWSDDWVGISLDALGTGQSSYHLMVNPSGVQLDMLNSVAGDEDESPDYVWDSAARRTSTGYAAEMRLPLQSIRFPGGRDVHMGILFWRRVSRTGVSVSWPPLEPGKWVFERHAQLVFDHLEPRPPREVIPSATYAMNQSRAEPARWGGVDDNRDVGVSAKYGLRPTMTVEATVNPDFSQVESDAFQVEVNQRFPVFFSEKRPFFMEGSGLFKLAGQGNDNSLQQAVHTRRIVDPIFGAKLTGTSGRLAYGTLTAVDQATGRNLPAGDVNAGKDSVVNVLRAQYSLGPSNYAGALVTDTEFGGSFNRVAGADLSWRVNSTQRVTGFLLGSFTRSPGTVTSKSAVGAQAGYEYSTRRVQVSGYGEHYDRDFEMQTAFINRVGISSGWVFGAYNFYPDKARHPWIRRAAIFSFTQGGRDRVGGGNELLQVTGIRFHFTRQGYFRFDRFDGFESWTGKRFDRGSWRTQGSVQLYRWLAIDGQHRYGDAVYYDPIAPFQGTVQDIRLGGTLQPSGRLSQAFNYRRVAFNRQADGGRVYDLDILYSRTTYQFSRRLFVRSIVQFDSSRYRVLTDFLGSYELRPGTVVYGGYGSLIEQRDFRDGEWVIGQGRYETSQRGVFLKASYLHRF